MKHKERFFRAILLSLTFNVKDVESTFPWSQELGTEYEDLPVRFGVCMDALIVLPERAFDLVWHGYEHLVNEHLQELGTLADALASKPERMTDNPQKRRKTVSEKELVN